MVESIDVLQHRAGGVNTFGVHSTIKYVAAISH